ncbi:hypothetical protein [Spiroplasma endosymbiont of Panorpa germanica]|uniref:hypothetical protein n=1 Tax=Spiroplasma endosymbiont of Panorpa germanica TaxID=3066314 RepID=UPI0030CF1FCD
MNGQNFNYMNSPMGSNQNNQFFFANGRWFYTYNMGVFTYPENTFVGPISSPMLGNSMNNDYFYNLDKIIMDTSLPKSVEDLFNKNQGGCNHENVYVQPAPAPEPVVVQPAPVYVQPAPVIVQAPAPEPVIVQAPAPEPVIVQAPAPEPAPILEPEPPTEMFAEFEKLIEESLKSGKKNNKNSAKNSAEMSA